MVSVTLDRRGRGGAGYSVAPILPALVDTTRPDQVDCTKLFLDALYTVLVAVKESYWFFLSLTKTQMFQNEQLSREVYICDTIVLNHD